MSKEESYMVIDPIRSPCPGRTRGGNPCTRPSGPSGLCPQHDPQQAAERGRAGRAKQLDGHRVERALVAQVLNLDTVEALRATLLEAVRMACEGGDAATMIRGVAVGLDLLKTADLAAEVADIRRRVFGEGAAQQVGERAS